jgi:OmpR-family two-component system manganese-sensing response regulator
MAKFLLVEDDPELADTVQTFLRAAGHIVEHTARGEEALQFLTNFKYDLIILDWGLPGLSGSDVCKRFRQTGATTPIIFTTGRDDIQSKEDGLDMGGDDYIVKPYQMRELSARIRSIMRRPAELLPADIRMDDVALNTQTRVLTVKGQEIQLAPKESALLEYLMRHPNQPCAAQTLLEAVWRSDRDASIETVRTWISNLRTKLAGAGKDDFIKTIKASGYVIEYVEK